MYADGRGTLQVTTSAHMWFNIASMNGSDEAFAERKAITAQMTPELINDAQKMAVACIKSEYRECGVDVVPTTNQQQVLAKITNPSSLKVSFKEQPLLQRKQLQYALKELGLYSSSIDGVFGRNTAKALSSFQRIQAVEEKNPEELFELIVSKVDVPSSFDTSTL